MKRLLTDILCAMFVLFVAACSHDDDNNFPPIVTDLLVASTDANGQVVSVRLDDGTTYHVAAQQVNLGKRDTTLRCMATYTHEGNQGLKLQSIQPIFSDRSYPVSSFYMVVNGVVYHDASLLPRSPMKVISMWKSGGYLNLHLGLMTTGEGAHQYGFCEDSVGHYSLLHQRPMGDQASYTEHVYMSMPLPEGLKEVTFSVNTYDGIYTQTF
ncbi:MAG: NigD-like N-terminal domain-containing protein [Bacteroidaceae bacterium]|nr:NigD-like N-terminal domain-containing protein [Bacteroidaceae bacterium]